MQHSLSAHTPSFINACNGICRPQDSDFVQSNAVGWRERSADPRQPARAGGPPRPSGGAMALHRRRNSHRLPCSYGSATREGEFTLLSGYGLDSFPQNDVAHLNVFKRAPAPVPLLSPESVTVKTVSRDSLSPYLALPGALPGPGRRPLSRRVLSASERGAGRQGQPSPAPLPPPRAGRRAGSCLRRFSSGGRKRLGPRPGRAGLGRRQAL